MTVRTKITLTIIGTLLVGILLGGAGSRVAMELFGVPPGEDFKPEDIQRRFTRVFERALEPTDEQRDTVRAILDRHALQAADAIRDHFAEQQTMMDSLKAELAAVVTEEQMTRLDRHLDRMHKNFGRTGKGRRYGRGRPPGSPPEASPPTEPPPEEPPPPPDGGSI